MVGPRPAEAAARRAVRSVVRDLAPGSLVLVACSGGADSLALAAATAFVASRDGLRAGAVVVDHGLQDGSSEVAAVAADRCRALGLDPVEVRRVEVAGRGGLEAAARHARYAVLDDVAHVAGASAVLLGHTLDDQAESVLLGLARGSGARSLAGMAAVRGVYRRPFLGLRRSDTEDVCTANGLAWWTDPTNGVPGTGPGGPGQGATEPDVRLGAPLPLRSQVRARVLPVLEDVLGPGVAEALARTADLLREDADLLDELADRLLDEARVAEPGGGEDRRTGGAPVVLDTQVLSSAPAALRRRALRRAATEAGSPAGSLFASHVATLDAMITDWRGQGPAHLPGDLRALRTRGRLFLRPARPPSPERTVPAETPAEPAQE
ncbi:tRNA lysidine(34) synthetase TilS [Oerskovia paurometabola]|uniref:tRNA(Ile)-lysidine synthase n=1 Tax=Oerskovia paurometabola TaxID=162170 RepID=A0ABW1X9R1_9CELL